MIYLGYDPIRQGTWARHEDKRIFVAHRDDRRIGEVLGGLHNVSTPISLADPMAFDVDGVEIYINIDLGWQCTVDYSDQAWNDLLEIGELVE